MQCLHKSGFLRLSLTEAGNLTDFIDLLVINKIKETSRENTGLGIRLHAKKMILR